MSYYFTRSLEGSFSAVKEKVLEALKKEGFGVITEVDLQATFKKKLNVDFYKYEILGACNPNYAYAALKAEAQIGLPLPCNLIIQQQTEGGVVEISAINPAVSMRSVENPQLESIANEVQSVLKKVIESLRL